jgi:hypothetical protein
MTPQPLDVVLCPPMPTAAFKHDHAKGQAKRAFSGAMAPENSICDREKEQKPRLTLSVVLLKYAVPPFQEYRP